jgi:hypothetical protein
MPSAEVMLGLAYVGAGLSTVMALSSWWDFVRLVQAHRRMAQVLSEREEYQPLLRSLRARADQGDGSLDISEHEAIDLRERVRQALVYLEPRDRKRVEESLRGRTVNSREVFLRKLLYASMQRLQHQG